MKTTVLRHNLTGLYFVNSYGFTASLENATRFDSNSALSVVRVTWGDNFTAILSAR